MGLRTDGGRLRARVERGTDVALQPFADLVVERAPALPGWTFSAYRPPKPSHVACGIASQVTGAPLRTVRAEVTEGAAGRIDLSFWIHPYETRSQEVARLVAFHLLGEECFTHWIGGVTVKPVPLFGLLRPGSPVAELPGLVQRRIDAHLARLPERPRCADESWVSGAVLEVTPASQDDFSRRADLLVAKALDLPVWEAATLFAPDFSSRRFSRVGEVFCYLKLDGIDGLDGTAWSDRVGIEDTIDDALASAGLGTVLGGGTGIRYSYIDLALTDLHAAVPRIRDALQNGRIGRSTWIQFFDRSLAQEWIGIWDDAPTPPGLG